MNRELEFDEVMHFLRSTSFSYIECNEIIQIIKENVSYRPTPLEHRVKELEDLTAKMDKVLELQYNNYKKVT